MTYRPQDFPLCPYDISRAPELASLALLEESLHISVLALCAAHPSLLNDAEKDEPSSLRRARRLLASIHTFRHALARYRDAVYTTILPTPPPLDELLF